MKKEKKALRQAIKKLHELERFMLKVVDNSDEPLGIKVNSHFKPEEGNPKKLWYHLDINIDWGMLMMEVPGFIVDYLETLVEEVLCLTEKDFPRVFDFSWETYGKSNPETGESWYVIDIDLNVNMEGYEDQD